MDEFLATQSEPQVALDAMARNIPIGRLGAARRYRIGSAIFLALAKSRIYYRNAPGRGRRFASKARDLNRGHF